MSSRRYYFLVSSLPRLDHFERAERLPITHLRLEQRLRALDPGDAAQLSGAEALFRWEQQTQSPAPGNEQVAARYRELMGRALNPSLREFIEFRMDLRTIVAALRRRQVGLGAPGSGEAWGAGRRVRWIEQHWDAPDFDLGRLYPWIPEARKFLEAGEAIALERLLLNLIWEKLGRIAGEHPFGFEEVFSFVFRLDILQGWLSRDPVAAKERFQKLIVEVIGEHQQLFN